MKLPILIIRTVSVEKLAPVLDACAARWPGHPLMVVTSPARGSELRTDPRITEIVPYATGATGFEQPITCDHELEAVVVPVANRGGSGYANVMRACRGLRTQTWFLASYSRELTALSRTAWNRRSGMELALQCISNVLGVLWGAWVRWRIRIANTAR